MTLNTLFFITNGIFSNTPKLFQFQEILKPNYNSVDLAEVELIDNMGMPEPRSNDTELLAVSSNT